MPGHFVEELRATFAAHADRPAIVFDETVVTYRELEERSHRFAACLRGLGIVPGDRVVLLTAKKPQFVVAHLGAQFLGAVTLPLNPRFTAEELVFFLTDSGARVAVASAEQRAVLETLRSRLTDPLAIIDDSEVWDSRCDGTAPHRAIGHDDPALILYSSGTTGRPKGVVHSHANLSASLRALQACWRFTPDDVLVNALPLFHIHGLSFASQLSLLTGSTMRIEETFHPRRTLDAIGRGTVFMGIPTFYYAFLDRSDFREAARGWQSVRLFTCGSAPIRPEVLPDLEEILGHPVINRYGMTEGHVITSLPLDGPWPRGSVGLPLDGIEVRVDRDDGSLAAAEEVGSVRLRGSNLFRAYWNNPEATRAALASGWFDTGDLGKRDASGFLTLVGRKHDLIITNGFNVYPQVVERVVNACPGVRESAVLGIPDARRGERVVAVIVRDDPALDLASLRAFWSERLVDYQRPSDVRFIEALPRNAMGKVLRRELREQLSGTPKT
jgi:malonyl-CoA/methylmalonyl-CoA synthetase